MPSRAPQPRGRRGRHPGDFLQRLSRLRTRRFPSLTRQWLISIAHGLCDQRARQESRLEAVAYEDQADEAVTEDEGPSRTIQAGPRTEPFDQRAALMMREVEGRSYAELVEILGISSGGQSLLFRARRAPGRARRELADVPPGGAGNLSSPRRPARRAERKQFEATFGSPSTATFRPRPATAAHGSARS